MLMRQNKQDKQTSLCQRGQSFDAAEKANLTVVMLRPRNLIFQFAGRQDGRKQANLPRVQRATNPSLAPQPHERQLSLKRMPSCIKMWPHQNEGDSLITCNYEGIRNII